MLELCVHAFVKALSPLILFSIERQLQLCKPEAKASSFIALTRRYIIVVGIISENLQSTYMHLCCLSHLSYYFTPFTLVTVVGVQMRYTESWLVGCQIGLALASGRLVVSCK